MNDDSLNFFIQVSSSQPGALGIFHAYGGEQSLARWLDGAIHPKKSDKSFNALENNELRYGWLYDDQGRVLDEVMIARPFSGMRALMTHGGVAVCRSIHEYFVAAAFLPLSACSNMELPDPFSRDRVTDAVLAGCVTERQAAAVLALREEGAMHGGMAPLPSYLLTTHRIVLAGPPNAGKSSLLNRVAGYDRAFVHAEAGATRDVVDELVDLGGYAVLLGDLPGFADDREGLGRQAWRKAADTLRYAEAVLFVCDGSREWDADTDKAAAEVAAHVPHSSVPVLVVVNKSDLPLAVSGKPWLRHFPGAVAAQVCSLPDGNAADILDAAVYDLLEPFRARADSLSAFSEFERFPLGNL